MSKFIKLEMFKDQNGAKGQRNLGTAAMPAAVPFPKWKVGYFVKSAKSDSSETWKIAKIDSQDGVMRHEDCLVTLQNNALETRTMKGSSLRSGYQFVSTGDVVEPEAETASAVVPARDDVQYLTVHIDGIREFYQRKWGEGSRVLMNDKTAYIVANTPYHIETLIKEVGGRIVDHVAGQ